MAPDDHKNYADFILESARKEKQYKLERMIVRRAFRVTFQKKNKESRIVYNYLKRFCGYNDKKYNPLRPVFEEIRSLSSLKDDDGFMEDIRNA